MRVDKLQAGRELDGLVSQKVMGIDVCGCTICKDTGANGMCEECEKPRGRFYSTNTDRALGVLEHLAEHRHLIYRIERMADSGGRAQYEISLSTPEEKAVAKGSGPTLALAACRAALNSV